MANFFVDRPVFAWVIAIVTMLAGLISLRSLPVEQYPDIAQPTVQVNATYPGASAQAVENTVTQVIEQQMNGLDGLDYISSTSSSSGTSTITLTFNAGTDPDIAQVQVQNKISLVTPLLPDIVQQQGVVVNKSTAGFLMVTLLYSPNGTYDQADLGDFVFSRLYDPVSRTNGVGSVNLFAAPYAMRIWLDPNKLAQFNMMPSDVVATIQAQNAQVSSGALGGTPTEAEQQITATITLQSLLQTPEDFANLPIRTSSGGQTVRLSDVARVELGSDDYNRIAKYNGKPAAPFAVNLATGANAVATAERVKERIAEIAESFPADVEYVFAFDSTPFIEKSLHEVEKTLIEAVILVFLVILIFLQSFRAVIIPMVAIPVVMLGTMVVFAAFGFTINTLTMFALVLAIGLLVDDAIVVVENVERVMEEDGLPPREATRKSMTQITGALVGIGAVLSAVFVPMAFFPGSTGIIYRQFSITIVSAMILSVLVAIILSPALSATLLKSPHDTGSGSIFSKPGKVFNRGFNKTRDGYARLVEKLTGLKVLAMAVFLAIVVLVGLSFRALPTSFIPEEDQGALYALVQLPVGASIQRTDKVMDEVSEYFRANEDSVLHLISISGFSFAGNGQNMGIAIARMKPWDERDTTAQDVAQRAMGQFMQSQDAQIFSLTPPAMPQLGRASGFDMYLQDDTGQGHDALINARNQLLGLAGQNPQVSGVRPNGQEDNPQFEVDIDYAKAQALGVDTRDITSLLSIGIGGRYVNDFIDRGRIKRVYVQGDAPFRMQEEDFQAWRVRNDQGEMTPLPEIISSEWTYGSPQLQRYNGISAVNIQGAPAPGVSSGVAMEEMEAMVDQLPPGFSASWTGISQQEREAGNQSTMLYILSALIVFLCLAALYESWTVPVAVLLVAPLGVAGAVAFAHARGLANDVFFQVGLVTTVGLASKNAILIVEFAKALEEDGMELVAATLEAAKMRFRPIIMTSFAFGLGVVPLALSSGAGAGARIAVGSAVLGGMIAATVLGVVFAPIFYIVVRKLTGGKSLRKEPST